ncbi:hypothetical protein LR48_Vigan102s005200 [Vigna angularis]|uniref:Uncharacterized protein n=1 Tax=Phaseolus angularis TaxID=3914 RepID=A0A0L9T5K8_PHAAN|nr:hypothetical protein LR48_Vigan102s005200 [Vigna angularis]
MENLQKDGVEMKKVKDRLAADLECSKKENEELKTRLIALTCERDALRQTITENQELQDEMTDAIILEHTRGFKKALRQVSYILNVCTEGVNFDIRKDVYQGELVPIDVIPAGSFPDDEPAGTPTEAMATEEAARIETPEGNSGEIMAKERFPVQPQVTGISKTWPGINLSSSFSMLLALAIDKGLVSNILDTLVTLKKFGDWVMLAHSTSCNVEDIRGCWVLKWEGNPCCKIGEGGEVQSCWSCLVLQALRGIDLKILQRKSSRERAYVQFCESKLDVRPNSARPNSGRPTVRPTCRAFVPERTSAFVRLCTGRSSKQCLSSVRPPAESAFVLPRERSSFTASVRPSERSSRERSSFPTSVRPSERSSLTASVRPVSVRPSERSSFPRAFVPVSVRPNNERSSLSCMSNVRPNSERSFQAAFVQIVSVRPPID